MKKLFFFLIAFLPVAAIIVLNLTISMVSETISISVESISFQENTIITSLGEGMQLNPSIFPTNASNKELVWKSSDETVVVITPFGEATFVNFGSAYITATTLDGNKSASIYFIITDTIVHGVEMYTLDNQNSLKVGQTLQIYSQVLPFEAENKIVYYSSLNPDVASINQHGVLTGNKAGKTTVVATTQDGGHIDTMEVEVYEGIISMSLPHYTLSETSSYTLNLSLQPVNSVISKVSLSSSNPSIATVDKNGIVVFLKPGIVSISAKYEDIEVSGQVEFTNGFASTLIVEQQTKTINYNQKVWQIDYHTTPQNLYNTEVRFVSSNPNVATVNQTGLVDLQGGGASIITISATKSDGSKIERVITLFVERNVEEVLAEDFETAENKAKIVFSALPLDATITTFVFETNSSIANVDQSGNITFFEAGEAEFTIFANFKNSNVFKKVKVFYTGGFATNFEIEKNIVLNSGSSHFFEPVFKPVDTIIKNINYEIVSQSGNDGTNSGVVSVSESGTLSGLKGGTAMLRAWLEVANGEVVSKSVNITVIKLATHVNLGVDAEKLNQVYITGQQVLEFSSTVLPASTSNKTVVYEIVQNPLAASLVSNKIVFNYPSTITLKATNTASGVFATAEIRYTTTVLQVDFKKFPTSLTVGQSGVVEIENYLPSNLSANISLRKNNETTKASGQVVLLNQNQITAVNGGSANIAVYVGGIYQTSFDIEVIRLAQSVEVYPMDIQITAQSINLNYTIYPVDTTQTQVVWHVEGQGAYIQNNVLYFEDYSVAEITATVNDEGMASVGFSIERVLQSPELFPPTNQDLEMFVGDTLKLNQQQNTSFEFEVITEDNEQIVEVRSDGVIKALQGGRGVLKYKTYNNYGVLLEVFNINLEIFNTVKQITLSNNHYDFHNGEYLTGLAENNLHYNLLPSNYVKQGVVFELLPTTIATLENDKIVFFSEGVARVKAVSEDGYSTNIWTIRYTGGYARDYVLNVNETINISKGQTIVVEVQKWIPFNAINKNLVFQTFSSEALQFVEINQTSLKGLRGGATQLLLRISDILTKTLTINVFEQVESVNFENKTLLTPNLVVALNPTVLPATATNKSVVYEIESNQVATIKNNSVVFSKPGTVVVIVRSVSNPQVFDTIQITSTAGYPNQITLNAESIKLFVGESFNFFVSSFSPSQASGFDVLYEIVMQENSHQQSAVSLNQNGQLKAISRGFATVKVSVPNPYGLEVFALLQVEVLPLVNNLKVSFKEEISLYNNIYITGQKTVEFDIFAMPDNALTTDYQILVSDQSLATVNQGRIEFLKTGIITITFTSIFNKNAKVSVLVNYVENSYIYVLLNEKDFETVNGARRISMPAGTEFEFEILQAIPSNIQTNIFEFAVLSSTPNFAGLTVAQIDNQKIKLLNGGIFEINVSLNNYHLGRYVFEVLRKAQDIETPHTNVNVSVPHYQISWQVLPQDSTNNAITFTSLNPLVATVNFAGQVDFVSIGTAVIVLQSQESNISKTITITYSRQVQSISFENQEITLSTNSTALLLPQVFPTGIDGYQIVFDSSNTQVATVDQSGRVFSLQNEGETTITAYISGRSDIYATIKVVVIKYITNIALELDETQSERGIASKLVFGKEFYTPDNKVVNTYQMKVLTIVPSDSNDILVWSSSNEQIATVNQSGLVSFHRSGMVSIRVQPSNQYNPTRPVYDSYTFEVVDGVNIYTFEQFVLNNANSKTSVLQANAILSKDIISKHSIKEIEIKANIHGNGYVLSAQGLNAADHKFKIVKNSIKIDNVILRGEAMTAATTLDDFARVNTLLTIWKANDIIVSNSILENAYVLAKLNGSKALFAGVIFQNAGFAHIHLSREKDSTDQTVLTVKNTIYKDAIIAAILFDFDDSKNTAYASRLIVEGQFLVYNFRQVSEMMTPALMEKMPDLLRNIVSSNANTLLGFLNYIKHTYNNKEYYNIAILAVDVSYTIDSMKSPGTVDMTQITTNYYRLYEAKSNLAVLTADARIYTIMPGNNSITPDSTFDSSIYKTIKEG